MQIGDLGMDDEGVNGGEGSYEDVNEEGSGVDTSGEEGDMGDEDAELASGLDSQPSLDTPLYRNSPVTLYTTLLLILAFSLSHKLTKDALSDLLSLLNVIILKPHSLPTSLYKFYSILKLDQAASIRHYYCPSCEQPLDSKSTSKCPSPSCGQLLQDPPILLAAFFRGPDNKTL